MDNNEKHKSFITFDLLLGLGFIEELKFKNKGFKYELPNEGYFWIDYYRKTNKFTLQLVNFPVNQDEFKNAGYVVYLDEVIHFMNYACIHIGKCKGIRSIKQALNF